jgi:hypothetical protein
VLAARERFASGPGLVLEIQGSTAIRKHFLSEYGARPAAGGEPEVVVEFGRAAGGRRVQYKSVHWRVELGDPTERPLRASVEVGGRPLPFALSLLQGYVVEPLVAIAAARVGYVLLPSGAVETEEGVVLLLGRSRTGKSSLCARALAAGRRILGDDHVFIHPDGSCRAFPRRLRVYSDLKRTAPEAFRRLPGHGRTALRLRAVARTLTRGYVAPPLRLRVEDLGQPLPEEPLRLARILAIRRDVEARGLERRSLPLESLIELAETVADEQRGRLMDGPNADLWRDALAAAREADREVLKVGFLDLPAKTVLLPAFWDATRSVDALAGILGIDG